MDEKRRLEIIEKSLGMLPANTKTAVLALIKAKPNEETGKYEIEDNFDIPTAIASSKARIGKEALSDEKMQTEYIKPKIQEGIEKVVGGKFKILKDLSGLDSIDEISDEELNNAISEKAQAKYGKSVDQYEKQVKKANKKAEEAIALQESQKAEHEKSLTELKIQYGKDSVFRDVKLISSIDRSFGFQTIDLKAQQDFIIALDENGKVTPYQKDQKGANDELLRVMGDGGEHLEMIDIYTNISKDCGWFAESEKPPNPQIINNGTRHQQIEKPKAQSGASFQQKAANRTGADLKVANVD